MLQTSDGSFRSGSMIVPHSTDGHGVTSSALWRNLLSAEAVAYETAQFDHASTLFAVEAELVKDAVPARVEEFAAGRACARRGLEELHYPSAPLMRHSDRRPRWPAGCHGSITHTLGYAAAAVARDDICIGLGIDAETIGRISVDLEPRICTAAELAWIRTLDGPERHRAATAIFSAKEAFYKSQSHLPDALREFQDVQIELSATRFAVRLRGRVPMLLRGADGIEGRYLYRDNLVFSALMIEHRP